MMPDNSQPSDLPPGPWTTHAPYMHNRLDVMNSDGDIIAQSVMTGVADWMVARQPESDSTPITGQSVEWLRAKGFGIEQHQARWQKFIVSIPIPTTGISRSSVWVTCDIDDYVAVAKRGNLGETCYLAEGKDVTQGWLVNLCRLLGITLAPETPAL